MLAPPKTFVKDSLQRTRLLNPEKTRTYFPSLQIIEDATYGFNPIPHNIVSWFCAAGY
jgi:hypothetical protein